MSPRSTDQRQGLGDGVWRLAAALLRAWDVATDREKEDSRLWFSAVGDVTASLQVELNIAGGSGAAKDRIQELDAVCLDVPARPPQQAHSLGHAIDGAVARLDELTIQRDVTWTKRSGLGEGSASASASSSTAAFAEALMADTVRILARCMELHPTRPSSHLQAKVCAAVLRVVRRRTVAVEFRRSIQALQSGAFEIKMGTTDDNAGKICVRFDAVWPAPSDLESSGFGTSKKNPGSGPASTLPFDRLGVATLADERRALQPQSSHGSSSPSKGVMMDYFSSLLQEWIREGFRHECAHQLTNSDIYGREDVQDSITMQLLSDDRKYKPRVICLAAKRGAGKTTLVRAVYNDQRVRDAFDLRLWLCMSEKFEGIKGIMTAIIEQATQVQCDVMELKFLRQLVQDELRERVFLLVLEDCHIEYHGFWRNIREILIFGDKRSAIIITTKSEDFTKRHCQKPLPKISQYFYNLSPLRDEHCLQILQQIACGDGDNAGRDHGRVISNVLYHCGGNPLHVKAICGLLCHAKNVLQQLDNLKKTFSPDLKLCHNILPQHLKLCLALCSLFPKDFVFKRHHLIRLWMSQGLIKGEEFGNPEEIVTQYFNELICRSFFEHSSLHDKKEDKFVMPKFFHDMVTSIAKDECLICEDLSSSIPEKIRYLSLVPLERRTVATLHPITKQVGNLDGFMVVNRSELKNSSMSSPFLKHEGLYDFLSKFKSLRTLNLSYTVIGQLPAWIGNLKNLQYLAVNNTDIRRLPSELCLLQNLQTLEARDCLQFVTLPEDTKNLAKLRHLDVSRQPGHVRMPVGVGKLMHLQSLPVLNVGEGLSDCSIKELRDLDNLHGDLTIAGLQNIKVGNNAKEAKLINKKYLETLTLEWSDSSIYFEGDDGDVSVETFESLQPPHDLENLIVRNYSGSIFPEWIEKFPYDKLQSITLDNCYNCSMIPALGDLQSLRYLGIRKMHTLKTFGYTASSEERRGSKFPALELLKLWEMYELDRWIVKDGDFPRLSTVSICGCPLLKSLPNFPSLVNLSFHHCNQLPEIQELLKLESLKIEGFRDIFSLDLPQGLPALKNLDISRCNNLGSVVGLSKLSSVEKLKIVKCPKLDIVNKWQQYHFKKISTTRDTTVISI
ncbi:hypothetical protein C2845_PM15G14160 [Panicum miliaceum]|uniref:Uncharacterized protein n=1 Tax=Panicum miliaceum TaxID=4540 RepID=A0A3L6Q6Y5_PANMI|nr:hypothetical protein C2845_PM15G14160 [Panicum miliaceum]